MPGGRHRGAPVRWRQPGRQPHLRVRLGATGCCRALSSRSSLETTGYGGSSRSLHIRASSPPLDRRQLLPGGSERQHPGEWLHRHAPVQSPLAARLPGSAPAPQRQLARNRRHAACSRQPRHPRRRATAATWPMPDPRSSRSPTRPSLPAAFENAVVTARIHDAERRLPVSP